MAPTFRVDSFHISVPEGDSAIHLLVEEPIVNGSKPTIKRAVLIDSGVDKPGSFENQPVVSTADDPIWLTIDHIEEKYVLNGEVGGKPKLVFDTIVITHWDIDHYKAITQILRRAAREVGKDGQIHIVKWDKDKKPATYFYCPLKKSKTFRKGEKAARGLNRSDGGFYKVIKDDTTEIQTVHILLPPPGEKDPPLKPPIWVPFAIFRSADEIKDDAATDMKNVLGVDFFTNIRLKELPDEKDGLPLKKLIKDNPPDAGQPAMYCVAVKKRTLKANPKNPFVIDDAGVTPTNQVSIAAIIVWPGDTPDKAPRVSHYFAGDIGQSHETAIQKWLGEGDVEKITNVKLSHHGSHYSTPLDMFHKFKPLNTFIPSPANCEHGHPSWMVIYLWYLWRQSLPASDNARLLATTFPGQIGLGTNAKGEEVWYELTLKDPPTVRPFFEKPKYKDFHDHYDKCYRDLNEERGKAGMQIITNDREKWAKVAKPDLKALRIEILERYSSIWSRYGFPHSRYHRSACGGYCKKEGGPIWKALCFVQIQSSADDAKDGKVYYMDIHDTDVSLPETTVVVQAKQLSILATKADPVTSMKDETDDGTPPNKKSKMSDDDKTLIDSSAVRVTAEGSRETDYDSVDCVGFLTDTFFIRDSTNPDEMDPPSDDEDDEDDDDGDTSKSIAVSRPTAVKDSSKLFQRPATRNATDGQYWSIYTSDILEETIRAGGVSDFERLPFGLLDDFVSDLHCGVLCLESKPPDEPPEGSFTMLRPIDEWRAWFADVLNAKELSILNGPNGTIAGFTMMVSLAKLGAGPSEVTAAWLKFTTDESILKLAFGEPSMEYISPTGIIKRRVALVFGLSLDTKVEGGLFVSTIVDFIGQEQLHHSPFMSVIGAIPLQPPSTNEQLKDKRNAIWFIPGNGYSTVVRLEWPMDEPSRAALNDLLSPLNLTLGETTIIARRSTNWETNGSESKLISKGSLTFRTEVQMGNVALECMIEIMGENTTLTLTLNTETPTVLQEILNWISGILGVGSGQFDFVDLQGSEADSIGLGTFHFRRIIINLAKDQSTGKAKLAHFRMDMEMKLEISGPKAGPTLFLLTYSYSKGDGSTLSANIWVPPPVYRAEAIWRLMPEYEKYHQMLPVSIELDDWQPSLDLAALAGFDDVPNFLPTQVTRAEFKANKNGISFFGMMRPNHPSGSVPTFSIGDITLGVAYEWKRKSSEQSTALVRKTAGNFRGYFAIRALIQQPKEATYGWPTQLIGEVNYSSQGGWTLSGSIYDLYASTLAQFFDPDISGTALRIMERIEVEELHITYNYAARKASSFTIEGTLILGLHRLDLDFRHSGKAWSFIARAQLDRNHDVKSTVREILDSVVDSDINLPDFLLDIPVKMLADDFLELEMKKVELGTTGKYMMVIIFTARLHGLIFQFMQFREVVDSGINAPPVKRVLIASMGELLETAIPMVGKVPQPFDEAQFLWVQPQGKSLPPTEPDGLTKIQLEAINTALVAMDRAPLPYKVVSKTPPHDQDVLITKGMHFMLMLKKDNGKSEVVLDYAFDKKEPPKSSKGNELVPFADDDGIVEDKGAGMAPYQKKKGALSINNIGLKYSTGSTGKQSILSIRLDASVTIGPVEFALIGFSLNLDFAGKDGDGEPYSLQNLPTPYFALEGLSAGFDRPPINIAGMLRYSNTPEREFYAGALTISYVPWLFQAAGYYGKTKKPSEFETIFLYCILRGPLITFQFASIEGVCGGFGYNSSLTFPTAQNVMQFPLITGPATEPGTGGPLDIMDKLLSTKWFFPKEESFWVAAGLTVKAFEILSVQAVIVIQWNPYVQLGIFALATASIPGGKSKVKFAHVELGIVASLDFEAGVLKIEGELTPNSFILDPSCHLMGGFALFSWFDSKDPTLRGDWVFTIGGFHPAYNKPPQYPNPPRLGISWKFGKSISISGQAYFAITPKACMGGGRLDVSLSLPPLYAWFNSFIDFLINFKPFSFIAEGGLSVGVKFTLDLWLVTINISVEIGARLYIKGPPIQGRVHVDFWVFGFDIDFGAKNVNVPPALLVDEFVDLVCQADNAGMSSMFAATITGTEAEAEDDDKQKPHVFAIEEGLIPKDEVESTPSGTLWKVRAATFEFSVNCKFAIENATVVTKVWDDTVINEDEVQGSGQPIYAKPMHTTSPISSHLTVTVKPDKVSVLEERQNEPFWNINAPLFKDVPLALWGKYDRSSDPSYNRNPKDMLKGTSEKAVNLMMGVHLTRPESFPAEDKTVPFDVELFQIQTLDAEDLIPLPPAPNDAFTPIESTGDKQWEDVQEKWKNPRAGEDAAEQTVDLFTALGLTQLGWLPKKVETKAGVLTGKKPKKLIDNIAKYYLWAPEMSGV